MKTIDLGYCCADCFDALNYNLRELPEEKREAVLKAGAALSNMADREHVQSLHSGDSIGFSAVSCDGCGNMLAGERWTLAGLHDERSR